MKQNKCACQDLLLDSYGTISKTNKTEFDLKEASIETALSNLYVRIMYLSCRKYFKGSVKIKLT